MKAPNFSLADQNGTVHTLSQYKGKWVGVYFYPRDDTPGCTKEACNFRDKRADLEKAGIIVLGISKDTVASHKKFADKYHLNFTLLADPSTETIKAYGAWAPKKFMRREFMGIHRKTFLINPEGEIVKEYQGMDLTKHAEEIINDVNKLK